jgi:Fe-S oxidoreductase
MARMKSEFLYRYQEAHGVSLRARLLASAEYAALWGSRLAPVSNWILQSRLTRAVGDRILGLDGRRTLPHVSRSTFTTWWRANRPAGRGREGEAAPGSRHRGGPIPTAGGMTRPRVAIFPDTFTEHYEPRQGVAAARLAWKLGADVTVAPRVCCGRAAISKGFLERAERQAELTVRALHPLAVAGLPIVFCEPGCFSAVKDDHPLLLRGRLRLWAEEVSAAARTFEEWAAGVLGSSEGVSLADGPERVLLHAHCHQKALVGLSPSLDLLGRIPGCRVEDAEAGCCGMAGSFGYEKEHYTLSSRIGERRLFPAIRERAAGTVVVASGFSCRQQIRHFTGVDALSAMELLEPLVEEWQT